MNSASADLAFDDLEDPDDGHQPPEGESDSAEAGEPDRSDNAPIAVLPFGQMGISQGVLDGVARMLRQRDRILAPNLANLSRQFHVTPPTLVPMISPSIIDALHRTALRVSEQATKLLQPSAVAMLLSINESFSHTIRQIAELLPTPGDLERLALPPNLRPRNVFYDPEVYEVWIEEAIPLAYVLDGDIINLLADTDTPQERRRILGRRRERIINRCEELLDGIASAHVQPFVENTRLAIAGFRDGHHQLAQTYAAANLESLVKEFDGTSWSVIRDEKQAAPRLFRAFFFVGQLRVLVRDIRSGPVPRTLNRHASVHFPTTRRQFSQINATMAIAHLVSAICNYDAAARLAVATRR